MKRVKAACILQTLVFIQKEDCGFSREQILSMKSNKQICVADYIASGAFLRYNNINRKEV